MQEGERRRERLTEREFDDVAAIVATVCGTSPALVVLVGADGRPLEVRTRRPHDWSQATAFCAEVAAGAAEPLMVPNAPLDPRFSGHGAVAAAASTRVGCLVALPLRSRTDRPMGTLCLADPTPHTFTASQQTALFAVARSVETLLELRQTTADLERALRLQATTVKELDTAKRDLEARVDDRRATIARILERIGDAFAAIDTEWRYTYVNQRAAELLGRDRESMIGQLIWDQFPEGVGNVFFDAYRRAVREQTPVVIEEYFAPWQRWFENRIYPSPDGLTIFFNDTTELRRAREAVTQSEARLRLAVAASGTGLWDFDVTNNEIYFSPEYKKMLGYAEDEFPNRPEEFLARLHPEDVERVMQASRLYLAAPEGDYHSEFRMRHRDGTYRWIATRAAIAPGATGQSLRMLGSHIDITAKKAEQFRLERSHHELRLLSGDLLKTREDDRARIAREIHDELGQSLTALKMDVAWLQRRDTGLDATWAQKLHDISEALDQTVGTVRRIASDLRPGLLDDLGLAAAIEWQAEAFQAHTELLCQADVQLADSPPNDVATALFRIVQESLTNVARHAQATTVVIRMTSEPDCWELTVIDDGVGMVAPETAGLASVGLTGMRERVRLVGGQLSIESTPGHGTTVRARVLKARAASSAPEVATRHFEEVP